MTDSTEDAPYAELGPDNILAAVESVGLRCDGHLLALNSYENRVYRVGIEDKDPVVAKFYRPGRWDDQAVHEEHTFSHELSDREIPVIAPLLFDGRSLFSHRGFRFALYPLQPGRPPELETYEQRRQMGRLIGRIHGVGAMHEFKHRPRLDIESYGRGPRSYLLEQQWIPDHLVLAYDSLLDDLLELIEVCFGRAGSPRDIRLHADCHLGNILWTDDGPCFVDLDDCRTGPAIQDLWMFISGDRAEMSGQLSELVEGYSEFYDFDPRELHLIEALRALRIVHHSAWLARRWTDPAFPRAFPWFESMKYWEEQILALREQLALLQEPPLAI